VIEQFGLSAFFLCLAGMNVALVPLLIGVREPALATMDQGLEADLSTVGHPLRTILSRPIFWAIVVGEGLLNAANITSAAHIVPIAIEQGTLPGTAALLLSVMGGASVLGSIYSGYLCDHYGAARTLALAGFGLAASWAMIAMTAWLPVMIVSMMISGICGAAVFPPINVLVAQVFGMPALPRVLGLLGVSTLPFTFLMSPAAGSVRDITGNYIVVMVGFTVLCAAAAINFLLMGRAIDRHETAKLQDMGTP
jgi:predicted MFS family arabinose efflux permease